MHYVLYFFFWYIIVIIENKNFHNLYKIIKILKTETSSVLKGAKNLKPLQIVIHADQVENKLNLNHLRKQIIYVKIP